MPHHRTERVGRGAHGPVTVLHAAQRDRQPESGARVVRREVRLEDPAPVGEWDPDSVVLDLEEDLAELARAAGLLFVPIVTFGGRCNGLAVRDARRAGLRLDLEAVSTVFASG